LEDSIYEDADAIISQLKIARNKYINEAVKIYNLVNKRRLLKNQLLKESKISRTDSMKILAEFESFINED
jgi:hypothetical protein